MPYIYKISNSINNKIYIGKTLYSIQRRWKQHLHNAQNRKDLWKLPLYAAMRLHGVENFSISEVEQVKDFHNLSEREKYWIAKYDSYSLGYNATRGGDGSLLYDYDYIWDLWESGLKIKEISAIVGCNDYVVRTVLNLHDVSTEERNKRSYEDQIASHSPYKRPIYQLDPVTEQIINEYSSLTQAAKAVNGDTSNISRACQNKKIYHNYKWCYKNNTSYVKKNFSAKQVCKIDLKTKKVIKIYPSASEAARDVNGDSSCICKVCKGKYHSSKGFGWCYLDDINDL